MMDDLLGDFIAETRETLQALAGEIVACEAAPGDRFRLDAIFRFVHTVKGSCGFLDLPRLERLIFEGPERPRGRDDQDEAEDQAQQQHRRSRSLRLSISDRIDRS